MNEQAVENFWAYCTEAGVVSKQLTLKRTSYSTSPVVIAATEPIKYGSPIVTVPYSAVLNCQTIRGDLVPPSIPSYMKAQRFLTRRSRMDPITAQSLWLAAFLATHLRRAQPPHSQDSSIRSYLSPIVYPPLPPLFTATAAPSCPSIGAQSTGQLRKWGRQVNGHIHLLHTLIQYHGKRRGIPAKASPSIDQMTQAYRIVMHRSMLLPMNCESSAPAELAEFLEDAPAIPLLPSLIPVIDLVLPVTRQENDSNAAATESGLAAISNSSLFTCISSDFSSAATRRRIIIETTPLSSRRVMLCAATDLKAGDELKLEFEKPNSH